MIRSADGRRHLFSKHADEEVVVHRDDSRDDGAGKGEEHILLISFHTTHLWRLEGVVRRKVNVQEEYAASVGRTCG